MEHRCGQRIPTDVPVSLRGLPAAIGSGHLLNMSATGAFIQTRLILPLLSIVYLEAPGAWRGEAAAARVEACVIRQCDNGIGVEWLDRAPDWTLVRAIASNRNSPGELGHPSQDLPPALAAQ